MSQEQFPSSSSSSEYNSERYQEEEEDVEEVRTEEQEQIEEEQQEQIAEEEDEEGVHVELLKASSLRRVPWASWDEWHLMHRWLFEDHDIASAIKRYNAWCSRGKVPLSVDVSIHLSRILYGEEMNERTRMEGALLLIRFVNGLTESLQMGTYAAPVHTVARNAGIPSFLVDIRHSATHSLLPSLETIIVGCKSALKWLEDNYWIPQTIKLATTSEKVSVLLQAYRATYRDKELTPQSKAFRAKRCLNEIIMLINSISVTSMQGSLVQPLLGFLVPNTKKPRVFEEIPKELKNLWSGALILFAEAWPHFIPVVVMSIAQKVSSIASESEGELQSMYAQSLYTAWYRYIIDQWGDVLCADQSLLLTTAECVMSSCNLLDSRWAEEIVKKTVSLAPQPLAAILTELSVASKLPTNEMIEFQMSNHQNSTGMKGKAHSKLTEKLLSKGSTPSNSEVTIEEVEKHVSLISSRIEGQSKGKKCPEPWEIVKSANPKPIGLLNDGELPDMDLPAELDDYKMGNFIKYDDNGGDSEWIPFSMREKSGKRKLLQKGKNEGKKKKASKRNDDSNSNEYEDNEDEEQILRTAEQALEEANSIDEGDLFKYLSNI